MTPEELFHNRRLNPAALSNYGFREENGIYRRTSELLDGLFHLTIAISAGGAKTQVTDRVSGDEYILYRLANAQGAFVGKVREAVDKELSEIPEHCFEPDVFKSECARRVIQHVRETYHDELQFLWKRFPENAVYRRQDNAKWYAALLALSGKKLGLDDDAVIDIIDLRGKPAEITALIDGKTYFPGYHMNKRHWFTIRLDGSVPDDEIFNRINDSYKLALK
ncbi:MmcQ/YjbR family DNA-binding protein [Victivallis sp. Marseille-Q1083]|uniref:MmcQ/YjbR family DNA-binding protein n=1 Tax=Victivallis sp. Marseille-Q1083 TaxID=2717288 RepID=UPI00158878E0|nr:MmcQ/YjbR family DNA-binding protein [Victivallis sp. Marseille-Q1083]